MNHTRHRTENYNYAYIISLSSLDEELRSHLSGMYCMCDIVHAASRLDLGYSVRASRSQHSNANSQRLDQQAIARTLRSVC
jgi:hypothetical protein